MKINNWLDGTGPADQINLCVNRGLVEQPLISLSVFAGALSFCHSMRPNQAKDMAHAMLAMVAEIEADEATLKMLEEVV